MTTDEPLSEAADRPVQALPSLSKVKQAICDRIAAGQTLLRLEKEAGYPTRETVRQWRVLDAAFDLAYTHARQSAGDTFAEKVIAISDKLESGEGDWAKDRAAMDGYKWAACKYYPKQYGEQSPRSLHQTYVANVEVVADEGTRQAMIEARGRFLDKGRPEAKPITSDNASSNKS